MNANSIGPKIYLPISSNSSATSSQNHTITNNTKGPLQALKTRTSAHSLVSEQTLSEVPQNYIMPPMPGSFPTKTPSHASILENVVAGICIFRNLRKAMNDMERNADWDAARSYLPRDHK